MVIVSVNLSVLCYITHLVAFLLLLLLPFLFFFFFLSSHPLPLSGKHSCPLLPPELIIARATNALYSIYIYKRF